MDRCLVATAFDKQIRIYIADTTALVNEAARIHKTIKTATAAFGRFLTITGMMGLMLKMDETITTRISCDGPIEYMLAVANAHGDVKGDILNGNVYLVNEKNKLDVGKAIGKGTLSIAKDFSLREPFTSQVSLVSGEIAEDFVQYYMKSEQIPTSISLGVLVDEKVRQAGGFIVQVMPNCDEAVIDIIENNILHLKPFSTLLEEGFSLEDILSAISSGEHEILEEKVLKYHCDCSKERYALSLARLDSDSLMELSSDEQLEIICNFCKKQVYFSKEEVQQIINKTSK